MANNKDFIVKNGLTVGSDASVSGRVDAGNVTITSTDGGSGAGPDLILYRNSASPNDGDYLGQIQFKGRNDGPGDEIYAKVTGKIKDSSNGTEDGLIETAIKGGGSFTIVSRQNSDALQLLNGVDLSVDGSISVGGTVDGRDIATDGSKLDGIESGATADQSASEILTAVKTVDGSGSGLDADLLDGQHASAFQTVAAPNSPSITSTTVVNETIELVFGQSSTSGVTRYEVWSDGATGSDYSLIAIIPSQDAAASMSVIDSSFDTDGTVAYRVYAVKNGVYSTAATTTKSFTIPSLDVSNMSVVSDITTFHVQYDLPDTRFMDHIEIYKDAETTLGALSRTGAALVYSGSSDNFTYTIPTADLDKFHQFWVEVVSV